LRKLKPTSLSRDINALPFRVRVVFSAVMFSEAAVLLYLLAILFPVELHIYTITSLITALLSNQTVLIRRRGRAELELKHLLEKLKHLTQMGHELELEWIPNGSRELSGEVIDNKIYIYEVDLKKAKEALIEEFVEYLIAEASRPYIDLINAIIRRLNEEAYRRRDRVAKAFTRLIKELLINNIV